MSSASCSFDFTPTNDQLLDCVFGYLPKNAPAAIFLALFFLAALVHIYIAVSRRSLIYAFITTCCLAEMAGYIARLAVIGSFSSDGYIAMSVLLLMTPSLLAIANYYLLGELLALSESATSDPAPTPTSSGNIIEKIRNHFSIRRRLMNLTQPRLDDGRIRPEFAYSLSLSTGDDHCHHARCGYWQPQQLVRYAE